MLAGIGRRFAGDTLFAYPGNGRRSVPTSQTVHGEWPASPGDVVGPNDTQTKTWRFRTA